MLDFEGFWRFVFNCIWVCLSVTTCTCRPAEYSVMALLELEFQTAVSHLIQILEIRKRSSGKSIQYIKYPLSSFRSVHLLFYFFYIRDQIQVFLYLLFLEVKPSILMPGHTQMNPLLPGSGVWTLIDACYIYQMAK